MIERIIEGHLFTKNELSANTTLTTVLRMILSIIRLSYRIWLREKLVRRISKHHLWGETVENLGGNCSYRWMEIPQTRFCMKP